MELGEGKKPISQPDPLTRLKKKGIKICLTQTGRKPTNLLDCLNFAVNFVEPMEW